MNESCLNYKLASGVDVNKMSAKDVRAAMLALGKKNARTPRTIPPQRVMLLCMWYCVDIRQVYSRSIIHCR